MDGIVVARQDESRALTGLRGVGALLVMVHHFHLHLALDHDVPVLGGLLRRGYLGVDLFFVLSGFVMAMVYGSWFMPGAPYRPRAFATFMVRRFARLWPLHAVVICVVVAEWTLGGDQVPLRWVAANLAMVQAWGISAEINPPAWSISTEILAYLLFPLLVPVLLRWRWGPVAGVLGAACAIATCLHFAPPLGQMRRGWLDIYFNYSLLPFLRCMAGFMVGMVAWRMGDVPIVRRLASTPWLGAIAVLTVIAMLLGRVNDLLIYPLLPVIVLGFHYGRGPAWTVLAKGPFYRLGVLSYAVYLVHVMLLARFPFGSASMGVELAIYLLEVTVVAVAAHWLVERPGRRLVRALGETMLARAWPGPLLQRGPG